jgi:hypothetical protein
MICPRPSLVLVYQVSSLILLLILLSLSLSEIVQFNNCNHMSYITGSEQSKKHYGLRSKLTVNTIVSLLQEVSSQQKSIVG